MKKTKTVEAGGLSLTISEISATRLMSLLTGKESILALPLADAVAKIKDMIPLVIEGDLTSLMAGDLYYDDMKILLDAFKETNPAFFTVAAQIGLNDSVSGALKGLLHGFTSRFTEGLSANTAEV